MLFSILDYIASNEGKISERWIGRKRSCTNLRYYPSICHEGLRKATKNLSLDSRSLGRDFNPGLPEREAGVLITWPRLSVQCHLLRKIREIYLKNMYTPLAYSKGVGYWCIRPTPALFWMLENNELLIPRSRSATYITLHKVLTQHTFLVATIPSCKWMFQ
jgi:hypothetical protein